MKRLKNMLRNLLKKKRSKCAARSCRSEKHIPKDIFQKSRNCDTTASAERRRIENLLADTLELAIKSDTPIRFDRGAPLVMKQEQQQRESYELYEGGPKCTVFGLDRTELNVSRAQVNLEGQKTRARAQKRADMVLRGLKDARLETMEEKDIAEAIEKLKGATDEPPPPEPLLLKTN